MLNTALRFMSECDSAGLKYRDSRDLDDGNSLVVCGINGKNNARYDIVFIFDKDGHSVQLRVFGLVSFPGEKADAMLKVANEMNVRYRWLKFCVNDMKLLAECFEKIGIPKDNIFREGLPKFDFMMRQ